VPTKNFKYIEDDMDNMRQMSAKTYLGIVWIIAIISAVSFIPAVLAGEWVYILWIPLFFLFAAYIHLSVKIGIAKGYYK
jgi:hypothetical protein